ncbi:MAG: hypothetical protein RJA81_2321, partial [Planctomycetota bacterium]
MRSQNKPSEDIWWQSLQRSPENIPPNADQCNPVLSLPDGKRIQTTSEWSAKRQEIRKKWLSYLGEIPGPDRSEMKWTVLESDDRDGVRRELIRYEAEPGLPIEGYLLRPLNDPPQAVIKPKSLPAVAVFHSTVDYTIRQPAGLEGPQEKWIGLHLAQAGYVTFCPRCYLWQYGEPRNLLKAVNWLNRRHPMVKGMTKMLYDSVRAVDLLLSLPEVNPRRIGSVGHSLGAKEVLYLAAFDERVRATVSSEGGIGIGYSNWNAPWYLDSA